MRQFLVIISLILLSVLPVRADEGMWLVQAITAALQQKMEQEGLEIDPKLIYDADRSEGTLCGAIVSMDFIGTGSVVSPEGLVITNHHVAFSDLASLNLLETGFWARSRDEELRIPKKKVQILRQILDVTEETLAVADSLHSEGFGNGIRKLSSVMERRYARPGSEVALQQMWAGEKYYIAIYEVYDDVRLVAAPPVSIAAFGGDEDNWEWPQQKGDFTLYRIYKDGKPLETPWHLKVSTAGIQEGDYAMVLGFPGRTKRYSSSFELRHELEVEWPITTSIRGRQMEIIRKWMDADPAIREKYADKFFTLSNVQELQVGQAACTKRFGVQAAKEAEEAELTKWIAADAQRTHRWGDVLSDLGQNYLAGAEWEAQRIWFRETLIRGSFMAPVALRMKNDRSGRRDEIYASGVELLDARVEKELLAFTLQEYYRQMSFIGPGQQSTREYFQDDWDRLAEFLWDNPDSYGAFLLEVRMGMFNGLENISSDESTGYRPGLSVNGPEMTDLRRRYTRALYAMREEKGIPQYPDANSSLRLTFGKVCSLHPWDAVDCSWYTTARGLFEKNDPSRHDFALPADYLAVLKEYKDPVDFLTDNDITGGNSGSPVLNGRGEVIGLAFDGNKESLSSDYYFVPDYTRTVCVDIRYVLFILERYAGLGGLVNEMTAAL